MGIRDRINQLTNEKPKTIRERLQILQTPVSYRTERPSEREPSRLGGFVEEETVSSRLRREEEEAERQRRLEEEKVKRQEASDLRKRMEEEARQPSDFSARDEQIQSSLRDMAEESKAKRERASVRENEAEVRLKEIDKEIRAIMDVAKTKPTDEQKARLQELGQERVSVEGKAKPFVTQLASGLTFGAAEPILKVSEQATGIDPSPGFRESEKTAKGKLGKFTGVVGSQLGIYGAVGGAVRGTALGQKILGGAGASLGRQIAGQQLLDLTVDTIAQAPSEVLEAVREDKTLGQAAKDFMVNRAIDVAFNVAIGGVMGDFKKAKATLETPEGQAFIKDKGTTLEAVLKQEPTKVEFAEGRIPDDDLIIGEFKPQTKQTLQELGDNSKAFVLTDLPKKQGKDIRDIADRTYQELVSKNAPFERIGKLAKDETLTARAGNLNRTTGTIDYNISKAQSDMSGNDIGLSMQDIFKNVPDAQKADYYDYMLNVHNIDRFDAGKPVFGDNISSVDSSRKALAYEQSNPKFKEVQQNVTKYFDNLLQEWGVKSGMLSQEDYFRLKDLYPNYVPTYRAIDIDKAMGGGNGNFVSNVIKKAKGSEKQILPIDQQMAMLTDRMIRNARKNEVMLTLDDVFMENPTAVSRYIKGISDVELKPVGDVLEVGSQIEKEVVKKGNDYLVTYYKDGVPKQMTINETLYNAMKSMEQDTLDKTLNVVRKYATNPFKSLITTYNPLFAVRNIMRDVPTALMYAKNPAKLVANVPEATKQMLTNGDLWKKYQALGGTRSGLFNYEKGVKLDFATDKTLGKQLKKGAQAIGDKAEAINNFTETLPRFAEFVTSMKETGNEALSLMRAAEVTTDFARFGKQTKRADAIVPYLNASVQGIDRFARQMRDKPLQTIARGGVLITAPSLILDQVNKNNDAYNEMSARERNQYYHIPKEDGTFWRIPRSREVAAVMGTTFEWLARTMRGEEVTGDEIMSVATENFTPVNGFDSNILKPAANFWKIVSGKDPDAKNFFGSKIIPSSLQKYSPSQQFDEKTTSIAKNLGAFFDVPPKAIDYLMDSYLGVIGDVAMPYLTDQKVDHLAPLERAFIADPVFKSDTQNKFYDTLDSLRKQAQDFNKQFDIPSKTVTPIEAQVNILNKFSRELSNLRKEQKQAQNQGKDDLVRALRQKMNDLSQQALDSLSSEEKLNQDMDKLRKQLGGN